MDYSVFAIEVAFAYDAQSQTRSELRRLILEHSHLTSFEQKYWFYETAAGLLLREAPSFERGCWDYFDNDIALSKYNEWCGGLLKEEGVRSTPSVAGGRGPYRASGETRYTTFTMAFLLARGSNTDRNLASQCQIAPANLWRRDTFIFLLQCVRRFNFANVRSDVIYMIPNRDDFGFTPEDLQAEKFKYLRPLV
ncbi:MAG: hypothetical protein MUF64_19925 [Polyangiaceae bacterium]|jgi:hypothetical protein|nr:hypothetical protein [Polyangiaceae bacterium]